MPSSDIKQRIPRLDFAGRYVSDAGFGQRPFGAVSLSPDGRRAAITIGDGPDAALYLADAGGGPLTMLAKPASWAAAWSPDGKWIAGVVLLPNQAYSTPARIVAEPGGTWKPLLAGESNDDSSRSGHRTGGRCLSRTGIHRRAAARSRCCAIDGTAGESLGDRRRRRESPRAIAIALAGWPLVGVRVQ